MPGALQLIPGVVLLWLALGLAGVFFLRKLQLVSRELFLAATTGPDGQA